MPMDPSTPKGQATRRRILDAAAEEFARSGIAGARIERITEAARTNKAQLYGYFGSKEGLFDAVVADCLDRMLAAVAFDVEDIPGWAARLYDDYLRHPDMVRLTAWMRLERQPSGRLFDEARHIGKLEAIAKAQAAGRIRAGDPHDLLTLVIAMSCAWGPTSTIYTATADEDASAHERRRAFLRESVERVIAPCGL